MLGLEISVFIPHFTLRQQGEMWNEHGNFQPLQSMKLTKKKTIDVLHHVATGTVLSVISARGIPRLGNLAFRAMVVSWDVK